MFEVVTREKPWKGAAGAGGWDERQVFPAWLKAEVSELAGQCWAQEPRERPGIAGVRQVSEQISEFQ